MTISWPFLAVALALLAPRLPLSDKLLRTLSSSRRKGFPASATAALCLWQNWVDLLRAAAGTFLLTYFGAVSDPTKFGSDLQATLVAAVVILAVLPFQMVRMARGVQIMAPVFFLCGVTLVLGGAIPGPFAVIVGWIFAIGGKNLAYQLPAMSVALAVAGYVLGGLGLPLMFDCALLLIPSVLALLFKKRQVFAATVPAV